MLKKCFFYTVLLGFIGASVLYCCVYVSRHYTFQEEQIKNFSIQTHWNHHTDVEEFDTCSESWHPPDRGRKTILLWLPVSYIWSIQMSLNSCSIDNCRLTTDRRLLNQSDGVIFHFRDSHPMDRLPTCRRPEQYYVYLNFESGIRSENNFPRKKIPRHFFNLTATYRRDSDFYEKAFGGFRFEAKEKLEIAKLDLTHYYGINIKSKTKIAAWFVSNCKTSINREGYVREMQKHIPVDVFGKCLENHKSCPRKMQAKCDKMLERDYLFYLSFENSFCPDYVTEKFYRAFETGTVPVVFGGANYSLFAPPHSFINARDFGTPKLLADYLLKLSKNLDLYSRYFDWRGKFSLRNNPGWPCRLCKILNDSNRISKSYEDIEDWFFNKWPCENYEWTNQTTK
ncbi:4-galactosyl-N-acetylglucosaminide 3-alpha-L-fucosyltransferase 9-like [Daphnia carinata]|uniref:4-galactosyl-N-acetylglucosaminide 3-alpha-L-fucosyltransferase 9-like n=1 Tax=Daphnia carinata TaxID=120202 RepID=UPI00257C4624|nr:4-galactosyl-N-acetylglucosaminide 3-alpha-L-fucosyltransferase 9-like [Daphnia carinata]